jgi:DNA-binding transcriptional ArsR family regulator
MRPRLSADDERDVFRALAHPIRRGMLLLLKDGERSASDLRIDEKMSPPSLSQHLRLLKRAGLVADRRDGRFRIYELRPDRLSDVRQFLNDLGI